MTALYKDVLLKLATFYGAGGCYPTISTLADAARASQSTVQRALIWAGEVGFLTWENRTVRLGNRRVRTSNRYRLIVALDEQKRAATAWLGRATTRALRRFVSPVVSLTDKVNRYSSDSGSGIQNLVRPPPSRSVNEWIDLIKSWDPPPTLV
ncbi:hypothetical protein AA0488_1036 [Kozakia baliensis NRIC 0488]|nr:hypothetical protein AA0488_1036 [Kozakia baliensis NRIC 0488]GEL65706.1 hypothetical protein KBA01_29920 [Kozakia baliensis]